MGALTIHFDDAARGSRRRARGPAVAAALVAGVVLGTLAGKTQPPPPRIVEKPVIVTQTVAVPVPVPMPAPAVPAPAPVPVARPRTTPTRRPAPLKAIRPVLEPANIVFKAPGSKMVRVTNPHDRPIRVDRLFVAGGGGYDVDASQCNGQTLVARGGSCTILITASADAVRTGSRIDLRMIHDGGRR